VELRELQAISALLDGTQKGVRFQRKAQALKQHLEQSATVGSREGLVRPRQEMDLHDEEGQSPSPRRQRLEPPPPPPSAALLSPSEGMSVPIASCTPPPPSTGALFAGWAMPSGSTARGELEMSPSQEQESCSQMSQAPFDEDFKCSICLQLFFKPVKAVCEHTFCRPCFYKSLKATAHSCPLCRKQLTLDQCDPAIDDLLWTQLQAAYPAITQSRAAKEAAEARARGESVDGPEHAPAALQRDRLLDEMRRQRPVLEAAMPDYFAKLDIELRRPLAEIIRCRCAARFVTVVKAAQGPRHFGRSYRACPLGRPPAHGGAVTTSHRSSAELHGCGFWSGWDHE
jgi:hypothetical protein